MSNDTAPLAADTERSLAKGVGRSATPAADLSVVYDIVYIPLGAAAYGGAERSLLELAAAQKLAGRRVLVCHEAALAGTDFVTDARARAIPLYPLTWSPELGLWQVIRSAARLFSSVQGRVVHFNISWRRHMWAVPAVARLRSSAQLLGTMRAMPEWAVPVFKRVFGWLPRPRAWVLIDRVNDLWHGLVWSRCLHMTVSVNRDDYPSKLIRQFGFAPSRMRVVYNGVRIPPDDVAADRRAQAKRALGYADGVFLVAYVGRLSSEKGLSYAIDALTLCSDHVQLLVAGDGAEQDTLMRQAREAGIESRVRFVGYVSDPFSVFSAADAAVVPSLWNEAFGRVVVEAMACSTPVIATSVGGMQELFEDGVHGLFVPKADADAIATAMDRLAGDKELHGRMAAAARQLAKQRYATERVASEYSRLYRSLNAFGSQD
jgi:glycosyltransferase involved in cell wall biosynthesis